jgi:NAD(P)-dependent dehydrogenase (short-subunit alcohol dehydrogenase family)
MKVPVCVIVGAGPGNGAAFARQFSRAGYHVALLARGRETLDALVSEIAGTRAYTYDATDPAHAQRVFAAIREDLGEPQTLIYNASTREFGDLDATRPDAFERAWRVNAYGCLLAAQQVVPAMRAAGQGNIIVIGATASLKGSAGFVAFGAAKAAQRSLAQSLARQLGPEGIHVSYVVIDAMVDLPGTRALMPAAPDSFFAKPDDIAESVFFLARQPKSAWTFELDLRPFREPW